MPVETLVIHVQTLRSAYRHHFLVSPLFFLWPSPRRADRLGVQEVVVQLERIQSLQLVTAIKGASASYGLTEFFDEQSR